MHFLLIGGTGFIGPHVAAALAGNGHDVTIFHRGHTHASSASTGARHSSAGVAPASDDRRPAVRHIVGDRRRLAEHARDLRALNADVVIDLVLSSGTQAHALMDVLRGATRRVVALSSCDVYRACGVLHGLEPGPIDPVPLTESSPLRTKLQTYPPDRIRMLQQVFGWLDDEYDKIPVEREILGDPALPGTALRLPMVYGPGDPLHRAFPLVKRMDDRRPAILFEEKHAAWRGPRGYVENVAAAIALAATTDRAAGRIYNVGESDNLTELDWARQIANVAGWHGEFLTLPAADTPAHLRQSGNLDQHWATDTTRIREELGYREPIARDEAIRRTIAWERSNPPALDPAAIHYGAEDSVIKSIG